MPKARITRTPVMVSRRRAFMRSMNSCSLRKMGADSATATAEITVRTSESATSTWPMRGSIPQANTTETTQITGTGNIIVKHIRSVCCTTLASDRVRVIMEPVPKRTKSAPESASDFSYTAMRRSRPMSAASCDAR